MTADEMRRFLYPIFLPFLSFLLCSRASPWQEVGTDSSLQVDHGKTFLSSPDKTFSCGFYSSGEGTNAYYFSIWYTHAADKTVVWTANPGSPVNGRGSKISLARDGNLVLTDVNGSTVWESRTRWGKSTTAALLDSGNLVIRDSTDSGKVWQSFDSPTDTLLPSQRLTRETKLVSQSGNHRLYFDNDNVLRLLYNGPDITSIYWPSPDYTALQNGRTRYNSSRIAVLDDEGNFLSSDGFRMIASDSGLGIKRRITIDSDGNFRMYSLSASNENWTVTGEAVLQMCYVHGLCGKNGICQYSQSQGFRCTCPPGYEMDSPEDWNKGCKPTFNSTCRHPQGDFTFIMIPHGDFYGFDLISNKSISFEECKQICLDRCSCLSFTYKAGEGLCYTKEQMYNGQVYPYFPGHNYIKLPKNAASTSSAFKHSVLTCRPNNTKMLVSEDAYMKNSDSIDWIYFYVFAAILGAVELLFIMTGWYFLFKMHEIPKSMEEGYKMITSQFRRFTYRELAEATGNFKEELGKGGSGTVYRGILKDKKVVAIKKLKDVRQGEEEFWAEVTLIGRINHINLVRMWGFCSEGKHRLLVYEYVQNESLDKYLFGDKGNDGLLSWSQRFKIALGTARGLAYLHHECLEWVVHCDVKPENILLTRDFEAKIADFGLSKLSKRDSSSFNFTHMRGTMGYIAPEWALNLPIDAKVDVYSYGVVLLEIVTGSRVSSGITLDDEEIDFMLFVQGVKQKLAQGSDMDIVDTRLKGRFNQEQATMMVKIAVSCLEERSKRPTMDQIAKDLMAYDDEDIHPAYF